MCIQSEANISEGIHKQKLVAEALHIEWIHLSTFTFMLQVMRSLQFIFTLPFSSFSFSDCLSFCNSP